MGNMLTNRMLRLKTRPKGAVSSDNFELSEEQVPELRDGQILVKVLYLSFDPTQRGWLNDVKSYVPPVQSGEIMRARSVGHIIESKDENFSIIIRTDANLVDGLEKTIERIKAYEEAGADIIFPESMKNEKEFEKVRRNSKVYLLANMTEFGKSKLLTTKDL